MGTTAAMISQKKYGLCPHGAFRLVTVVNMSFQMSVAGKGIPGYSEEDRIRQVKRTGNEGGRAYSKQE